MPVSSRYPAPPKASISSLQTESAWRVQASLASGAMVRASSGSPCPASAAPTNQAAWNDRATVAS